jgi:hypothetical protein
MRWPWSYNKIVIPDEPLVAAPPLPEPDLIRRGEIASRLLQDPVLAGAFTEIRTDAYRLWLDTKPSETARREELYRVIQALELVRGKLLAYRGAATMKIAERAAEGRAA